MSRSVSWAVMIATGSARSGPGSHAPSDLEGHGRPLGLARGHALLEREMLLDRERRARCGGDGPGGRASPRRCLLRRRPGRRLPAAVAFFAAGGRPSACAATSSAVSAACSTAALVDGGSGAGFAAAGFAVCFFAAGLAAGLGRRLLRGRGLLAAPGGHHRPPGVTPLSAGRSGAFLRGSYPRRRGASRSVVLQVPGRCAMGSMVSRLQRWDDCGPRSKRKDGRWSSRARVRGSA